MAKYYSQVKEALEAQFTPSLRQICRGISLFSLFCMKKKLRFISNVTVNAKWLLLEYILYPMIHQQDIRFHTLQKDRGTHEWNCWRFCWPTVSRKPMPIVMLQAYTGVPDVTQVLRQAIHPSHHLNNLSPPKTATSRNCCGCQPSYTVTFYSMAEQGFVSPGILQ